MIRFCDNEICCITYDEMDRTEILNYFFQNHMDDIVCVVDFNGKYEGKIIYYSLINTNNIFEAIQKDYAVFDQNFWENARNYFSKYKNGVNEHVLLPVVDKQGMLLCFAYEEMDANREMRMLRELIGNSNALQFSDIYPEYKGVRIYEFNELAYFFAKYLESQNIEVQVFGELWEDFFQGQKILDLSFKIMDIYAEGVKAKHSDWINNLLESVSAEFECIDIIYETNIKNGVFQDGGYTGIMYFSKRCS